MSEWSSEWGSGGTREVTAGVGRRGRSGAKVTGFQLGEGEGDRQTERRRGTEGGREGSLWREGAERESGQENFPDDFSLRLVPIFFVMWRAKNEQRRKGIGRGELEGGKSVDRAWVRRRRSCTRSRSHTGPQSGTPSGSEGAAPGTFQV